MSASGDRAARDAIAEAVHAIHLEAFETAPRSIQTLITEDSVLCVVDVELLPFERIMVDSGRAWAVREGRRSYQEAARDAFVAAVERATGRRVVGFLSDTHIDPAFAVEYFRLAEEPEGA